MIKWHNAAASMLGQDMEVHIDGYNKKLDNAVYDATTDTLTFKIENPDAEDTAVYLDVITKLTLVKPSA